MVDFNSRGDAEDQKSRIRRETDPTSLSTLATYLFVGFLLAMTLLAYCWEHQKAVKLGYEIEKLKKEKDLLSEVYQKLTLERASLLAPQRVSDFARQHLGFTYTSSESVIFHKADESQVGFAVVDSSLAPRRSSRVENQREFLIAFNQVSNR